MLFNVKVILLFPFMLFINDCRENNRRKYKSSPASDHEGNRYRRNLR